MKTNVLLIIFGSLGVVLIAVGCVMFPTFTHIIRDKINSNVPLINGSESYKNWVEPSAPVYMQFWVWNITNTHDVVSNGSKPRLVQKGPYTYREIRPKFDVEFDTNQTRVSYRQNKSYVFEPTLSIGKESDSFFTANLLLISLVEKYKKYCFALGMFGLSKKPLFTNYTVGGFLWGYEDETLGEIITFLKKWHLPHPKSDRFGLFYGPSGNGTNDGEYVVNTGLGDVNNVNMINTWKGKSTLPYWKTKYCNMINGTDGSMWHPFIEKSEKLYLFSSDICRSIYLEYNKEEDVKGIKTYRFMATAEMLANHTVNPDNAGFCIPDEPSCYGSGVLNVSPCKEGAPIAVSLPHFFQGADKYKDAVIGMSPSNEFETFVDVEPLTGVTMHVGKKLQLNVAIKPDICIDQVKILKEVLIYPMLWLNETAIIGDEDAVKFKSNVFMPISILTAIKIGLVVAGGIFVLCCLIVLLHKFVNKKYEGRQLLNEDLTVDT